MFRTLVPAFSRDIAASKLAGQRPAPPVSRGRRCVGHLTSVGRNSDRAPRLLGPNRHCAGNSQSILPMPSQRRGRFLPWLRLAGRSRAIPVHPRFAHHGEKAKVSHFRARHLLALGRNARSRGGRGMTISSSYIGRTQRRMRKPQRLYRQLASNPYRLRSRLLGFPRMHAATWLRLGTDEIH